MTRAELAAVAVNLAAVAVNFAAVAVNFAAWTIVLTWLAWLIAHGGCP